MPFPSFRSVLSLGVALAVSAGLTACSASSGGTSGSGSSGSTGGGTTGGSTSGGMTTGGTGGMDAGNEASAAAYLAALPGWPMAPPDSNGPIDAGSVSLVAGDGGVNYRCTDTPYSLTSTPNEIVTFNPNIDVLWPGGLLQGGPLRHGVLAELPLTERAPLQVTIPTLLTQDNTLTVDQPSVATVEQAIGQLVTEAVNSGVAVSSSINYKQTEAFSADQAAFELGINAGYYGFDLNGSLSISSDTSLHSVVGYFTQNMFTVAVPEPEQPADLFNGLTQAEIDQQVSEGNLGPSNLPVYVASVTYGRIMMFSLTSSESTFDIKGALNLEYSGGGGDAGVSASYKKLISDSSTTFKVVTVGGAASDAEAMIKSGDPSDFFSSNPPISTAVPISYTLRNLSDNRLATVTTTTDYTVSSCVATQNGPGAAFYVGELIPGASDVVGFDIQGNKVALTVPIGGASLDPTQIVYDSFDDRIYVLSGAFSAYKADGTPLSISKYLGTRSNPASGPQRNFNLFYDARYNRLYVAAQSTFNNYYYGVQAFSPDLALEAQYTLATEYEVSRGTAFDPATGLIYVEAVIPASATNPEELTFHAFELNGTPVALPSSMTSVLKYASALAYDPNHQTLYVVAEEGSYDDNTYTPGVTKSAIWSIKPDGTLSKFASLGTLWVTAMTYDYLNDRLALIAGGSAGANVVLIDQATATQITTPNGAFDASHPISIAFRPFQQ